jgi:hypothetical protein
MEEVVDEHAAIRSIVQSLASSQHSRKNRQAHTRFLERGIADGEVVHRTQLRLPIRGI